MKKIKSFMLMVVVLLTLFVFCGTTVNAIDVTSLDEFKTMFEGSEVTYNGSTVTLNENVTIDDLVSIVNGEYGIDLNGFTLEVPELYVEEATLTISDSTKNAQIITSQFGTEQNGTIIINRAKFVGIDDENAVYEAPHIYNLGTCVIKDAVIEKGIFNDGSLTIEYAEVPHIEQLGTAIINGGKFKGLSTFVGDGAQTTIKAAEFSGYISEDATYAIMIQSAEEISESDINSIIADGSVLSYDKYTLQAPEAEVSSFYTATYGTTLKVVNDVATYSDVFKKITADGTWVVDALAPKSMQESAAVLTTLANNILNGTGYQATAYADSDVENFSPDKVLVCIYKDGVEPEEHIVKAKYADPNTGKAKTVIAVLNNLKYYADHNAMKEKTAYILDDLYLINYLYANSSSSKVKGDQALNFAKELIDATKGANISFKLIGHAGGGNPEALYTFTKGDMVVYYDGTPFTSRNAALTSSHVLYIPDTTADTDDAYIAAALKRIKDYMGKDIAITIVKGGTLDSLTDEYETYNEYDLFDATTAKTGNYYTITVNSKKYNFAICEKPASELTAPKYVGSNLGSNVVVKTDVTTVPLDTAVTVKEVKNDTIKKALGTTSYAAYDISLYSNAKATSITKLTNGKFEVTIPVPDSLKDKQDTLTVYYVDNTGKTKDQKATVKKGIATFETDHFSTYVIAEKQKDVTPGTGLKNNIQIFALISAISFTGYAILKSKKEEQN